MAEIGVIVISQFTEGPKLRKTEPVNDDLAYSCEMSTRRFKWKAF
jgi:hypothetical protein